MNLVPEVHSGVVGSLLGDAYLYPNGTLQIEHSLDQASYVWWKYEVLGSVAGKLPTAVQRYDARYNKTYQSLRFYTRAVLKELRVEFYRDRRKVIPAKIAEWLDPLALAVWFMDDGGRGARTPKGLVINTSGFSADEQLLLQRALVERFGVSVSIHTVGKGFQLYVRIESFDRFAELVSPYLLPQMSYKLPVDPVTTEGKNPEMVIGSEGTICSHHHTSALAVGLRDEGIV